MFFSDLPAPGSNYTHPTLLPGSLLSFCSSRADRLNSSEHHFQDFLPSTFKLKREAPEDPKTCKICLMYMCNLSFAGH